MVAISAGLQMSPIFRLAKSFAKVPEKHHKVRQVLISTCDVKLTLSGTAGVARPHGQSRQLQELSHSTSSSETACPSLPVRSSCYFVLRYSGRALSDLTFMEDGNPDNLEGLINFRKREMLFKTIWELRRFRLDRYSFAPVEPLFTFLQELPHADENELFALSLEAEPRVPRATIT